MMAFVVSIVGSYAFSHRGQSTCGETQSRAKCANAKGYGRNMHIEMKVMTSEEKKSLGDFVQGAKRQRYLTRKEMDRICKTLGREQGIRSDAKMHSRFSSETSERSDRVDGASASASASASLGNPGMHSRLRSETSKRSDRVDAAGASARTRTGTGTGTGTSMEGMHSYPVSTALYSPQRKTTRVKRLHSPKSSTTTAAVKTARTKTAPTTTSTSTSTDASTSITDPTLARETLVLSHLRLVSALARRQKDRAYSALPVLDLIQEGCMGLIRAASKYDPSKQVSFASYAIPWIQHYMQRAEHNQARMIRMPVHLIKKTNTIAKERSQLALKLGRQPGPDEIADALHMNPSEIQFLLNHREMQIKSLDDQPIGPHGESWRSCLEVLSASELSTADDYLANHHASAESNIMDEQRKEMVNKVLSSVLTVKEQEILKARFGLDDGTPKKLQEIADMRRVTRPNVQQTVVRALKKLQNHRKELQSCMDAFGDDI